MCSLQKKQALPRRMLKKSNNEIGQYSSAKVHKSLEISLKDDVAFPASIDDFVIQVNPLEGLEPEIINGI